MGIVIRQSFWAVFFAYCGVAIGFLNAVILMPRFMTPEEIGLWRTLASAAAFTTPLVLMGSQGSFVKFLPGSSKEEQTAITRFLLLIISLSFLAIAIPALIYQKEFASAISENKEVKQYIIFVLLLMLSMVIYTILETLSKANLNIATPNLIREVLYKALHLIIIVLFGLDIISFNLYLKLQLAIYFVLIVSILLIVLKNNWLHLLGKGNYLIVSKSKVFEFSVFNVLNGLGVAFFMQADKLMLAKYASLKEVAIYTTAIYITSVISIPTRYIGEISNPIISKSLKEKNFIKLDQHYKSSAVNQIIISVFAFSCIYINANEIFAIMPNGELYKPGIQIILLIGITKIINGSLGLSASIIGFSDKFRVNTVMLLIFGFLNIALNYLLIPQVGIMGPAIATLISYTLFDVSKYIYVKKTFKLDILTNKVIPVTIFVLLLVIISHILQDIIFNPYLSVVIKVLFVTALTIVFLLVFKPTRELEDIKNQVFARIKKLL